MSRTYAIACTQCREQLWIGQSQSPLYYSEPDRMAQLSRFLVTHRDHPLVYKDDEFLPDYKEFENLDEREWEDSPERRDERTT